MADGHRAAAIVFSASLTRLLSTDGARLPPTYVGVRRVRPSSLTVRNALKGHGDGTGTAATTTDSSSRRLSDAARSGGGRGWCTAGHAAEGSPASPPVRSSCALPPMTVVYKTTDEDGVERRMTKKEKKELRNKLRKERYDALKEMKKQAAAAAESASVSPSVTPQTDEPKGEEINEAEEGGAEASRSTAQQQQSQQQPQQQPQPQPQPQLPSNVDPAEKQETKKSRRQYHTLNVNRAAIEEELAELRGECHRVPPVVLSGPMVHQAMRTGILLRRAAAEDCGTETFEGAVAAGACSDHGSSGSNSGRSSARIVVDDNLGKVWADAIQDATKVAEDVRSKEAIRPLAYRVVPEVWSRLRPEGLCGGGVASEPPIINGETSASAPPQAPKDASTVAAAADGGDPPPVPPPTARSTSEEERQQQRCWSYVETRRPMEPFDADICVVYDQIYRSSALHASCGAKFGCDLLLYDGRREERHAFAGLRLCGGGGGGPLGAGAVQRVNVVDSDGSTTVALPVPSAYDLAGYVRCLNTAGKLALLATVLRTTERDGREVVRVAFVDLALEKILSAPTHQKKRKGRKRKQIRKEGDENLAKKRGG